MEKRLFDWPIMLQYYVKAKYRLISRKLSSMKYFHPTVHRSPTKSHALLYPFDKPIKSLYFRSFVVSVLFARFHFKVTRKSLYHFLGFKFIASPSSKHFFVPFFWLLVSIGKIRLFRVSQEFVSRGDG